MKTLWDVRNRNEFLDSRKNLMGTVNEINIRRSVYHFSVFDKNDGDENRARFFET